MINLAVAKKMTNQELLDKLNEDESSVIFLDSIDDKDKEDFEGICSHCYAQTVQKSELTVCEECQSVEPKTYEITSIKSLNVSYNWNSKKWIKTPENLGEEDSHI